MAAIPRIVVEAFQDGPEGEIPLGKVDLTAVLSERLQCGGGTLKRLTEGDVFVQDVIAAIPEAAHSEACKGNLELRGLRSRLRELDEQLGGLEGFRRLHEATQRVDRARRDLERAQRTLSRLSAARWESDTAAFEMVYGEQFTGADGYAATDDLAAKAGEPYWDEFAASDPYPRNWSDPDDTQRAAWNKRFAAFVRAAAQPFAFGTRREEWPGVGADEIRAAYGPLDPGDGSSEPEFDRQFNVADHVDSEVSCLFDDALDHVVDLDGLASAVEDWKPHAGKGTPEDLALEAAVAEWNAKQTIVSFWPDETVAVPVFPDVTRQEALAWCAHRVSKTRAALAAAENSWEEPAPPEQAAAPSAA